MAPILANESRRGEDKWSEVGRKRVRFCGFLGLLITLSLLALTGVDRPREGIFDLYQRLMPRSVDRFYARIVEIDEASLTKYGSWPWPRFLLAELAQKISQMGALAIGFDILFPEPDRYGAARFLEIYEEVPDQLREGLLALRDPDQIFARTIGRLPVALGRSGVINPRDAGARDPSQLYIEPDFVGDPVPETLISFPAAVANIELLDSFAAGHGLLNSTPDHDGVIRRMPLLAKVGDQATPALALELLRVAVGADAYVLETDRYGLAAITVSDRRIPTERDGRLRLHFSAPLVTRAISAVSVLDGNLPDDAFAGTIVIVGASALGLEDIVSTPVAAENLGADIHAQTIDSIISERWLERPEIIVGLEWLIAVFFGLIAIIVFPRLSPGFALILMVAMILLVAGSSALSFAELGLLLDPTVPVIGGSGPALVTLAMMLIDADKRRRAVRATLIEERVTAARVSAELAVAQDIQLRMLPDPASLRALSPAVDLAVKLETARTVGGDLYDAVMLDRNRLYFMIGDVTGKGVPAALFMALSKALTKESVLRHSSDLSSAVQAANRNISRENPGDFFVSAILAILDLETGEVEICNAGHHDPSCLGSEGLSRRIKLEGGPPLSAAPDYRYPLETTQLDVGDILILTTDGVFEANDDNGALFGSKKLDEVLNSVAPPRNAGKVVDAIYDSVTAFRGETEPSDDLAILVVQYLGPAS